ncbi:hypothetical protein I7I53_07864 [Histoplasma capsulatum var. duboisii H88]|uniref:Uncharacterized protein n=1 Tax=Ajellomyces capsulatus (strain H88) TaxID=544711 RepID=A0A8A1LDZ0_AJEC8|nr:hypothetical protein I7I53_07864 [Histoplasma capsulatum var. duboisii H88]
MSLCSEWDCWLVNEDFLSSLPHLLHPIMAYHNQSMDHERINARHRAPPIPQPHNEVTCGNDEKYTKATNCQSMNNSHVRKNVSFSHTSKVLYMYCALI